MSEDMTYCVTDCKNREDCYRNPDRIKDRSIPHSYSDFSGVCARYEKADGSLNIHIENDGTYSGGGEWKDF